MATQAQLKKLYPFQSVEVIDHCPTCKVEIAISPSSKDRGMTKKQCKAMFGGKCKACLEKERAKEPHWTDNLFKPTNQRKRDYSQNI